MKPFLANSFLALSAVALAGANWMVYHPGPKAQTTSVDPASVVEAGHRLSANPKTAATDPGETETTSAGSPSAVAIASFDWSQVETADYKEYAQRLRAIGFPEELMRSIIIADVDKLYAPREQVLKPPPVPYDTPISQRIAHNLSPEDWQRVIDLWNLRIEKQTVLQEILGCYIPREILKSPNAMRNYEAYEYAVNLMPAEKRYAVQIVQETEILKESMNNDSIRDYAAQLEAFKQVRADMDASLRQILTSEEFEVYEMNTAPVGTELARQTIGMEPTEQEFVSMFRIASKNWFDTGGVYGRWRAIPLPSETIAAANQEMNESLEAVLGPDRFVDYLMAISETGQKLRNFTARFDLPPGTAAQAFELQYAIDNAARPNRVNYDLSRFPMVPARVADIGELQVQLQQVLGPQLWQAWLEGRNLRVKLDP